ncbi:molybdate ABC transporter substrate-binding protein [Kiloniella sp.]|uniref:molybdate ABC transporter substrate-binding protein n=1 Tax=Kiloniella sp. TaxID=1938587 RepID=UPI003B0153BA
MYYSKGIFCFLITVFSLGFSVPANAEKTTIAVAANFTAAAKELAEVFTAKTDHEVALSFGSTGKLFTQIIYGAPFDVFLAADSERPKRAEQEGLTVKGTRFTYAQGQIVLWSRGPSHLDPKGSALQQVRLLQSKSTTRLAIANPKTAPYGRAALEALTKLGVYDDIKSKIVQGENIAQTYQFAYTGNAELAVVSLSQITLNKDGAHWVVPLELYAPLDQQVVLLKKGAENKAAIAFISFLKSNEAAVIIREFGYTLNQE